MFRAEEEPPIVFAQLKNEERAQPRLLEPSLIKPGTIFSTIVDLNETIKGIATYMSLPLEEGRRWVHIHYPSGDITRLFRRFHFFGEAQHQNIKIEDGFPNYLPKIARAADLDEYALRLIISTQLLSTGKPPCLIKTEGAVYVSGHTAAREDYPESVWISWKFKKPSGAAKGVAALNRLIEQSKETAEEVERENLSRPFQGGLPSLGKRR